MNRLLRRLLTFPGVFLALLVALAAAPLWLLLAAAFDLASSRPTAALRTSLAGLWILCCEALGILGAGALWLWHAGGARDRDRYLDRNFALQCRWAGTIFRGARAIFDYEVEVEPGGAPVGEGPVLLLLRHASLGDTLLPALLLSIPHGIRLRYVLKRELLWDPCLDLVGHRLPNVFVDREGPDAEAARAAVSELARDLGPRDGVLIYPEGTRFTPQKQQRARDRLRVRDDSELSDHAETLRHLLPPRLGGTLALLDQFAAAGTGHVIVCGHQGFEGSARLVDLLRGKLVGRRIRVRCWSTPASALPADRRRFLLESWSRIDAWLDGAEAEKAQDQAANSSWNATS